MKTLHLKVDGMTCNHCVSRVDRAIRSLPQVEKVGIDLKSGQVLVESGEGIELAQIQQVLTEDGYTAHEVVAPD